MQEDNRLGNRLNRVNLFGVRHLSPSSADNLIKLLDHKKPKVVLVEGPSDANEWIETLLSQDVTLPTAILSYTETFPISSVIIPFAEYSPEFQALKWAKDNIAISQFIDLPSSTNLSFMSGSLESDETKICEKNEHIAYVNDIYNRVISLYNESNYEAYWESNFEYIDSVYSYMELIDKTIALFRNQLEGSEQERDEKAFYYNLLRERFMVTNVTSFLDRGYKPDEIVVVVGAYHLSGLRRCMPFTANEVKQLPTIASNVTLMPYSYYKLSSMSGYGAGTHAPEYFDRLWRSRQDENLSSIAVGYATELSHDLRAKGFYVSTASVIEAVRLANRIASIRGRKYPTLQDIKDGIVTTIGEGKRKHLEESMAMLDVGIKIGALKQGISQTSIQNDFNHQLKRLKLGRYKTVVANDIKLDLRENIRVKSKESAFLDLNRSIFFNKLELLGIEFAERLDLSQASGTWAEGWQLIWTPEVEIQIIETIFKGESIDIAAGHTIDEMHRDAKTMGAVAKVVKLSFLCNLTKVISRSIERLEELFALNNDFIDAARTCIELSNIIKYKDLRRVDPKPCEEIFIKLFNRSSLLLERQAAVNDDVAAEMIIVINGLYSVSQEFSYIIDYDRFVTALKMVSLNDSNHPLLCGVIFSILMEKQEISRGEIDIEISRRLSIGNPPDLAGEWFYGLATRNRYALLSKIELWEGLDNYLNYLDDDGFLRVLVYLRRALCHFDARDKTSIVEMLSDLWNVDSVKVEQMVSRELSVEEEEILTELDEFDFDDLL